MKPMHTKPDKKSIERAIRRNNKRLEELELKGASAAQIEAAERRAAELKEKYPRAKANELTNRLDERNRAMGRKEGIPVHRGKI